MIRIGQIKLSAFLCENEIYPALIGKAASKLKTKSCNIKKLVIVKKSLDARKKNDIVYVYTVDVIVPGDLKIRTNNEIF